MLPTVVLILAIRAEFWQPRERKGKVSYYLLPIEHTDIQIVANNHVKIVRRILQRCQKAKKSPSLPPLSSSLHLFRQFLGNYYPHRHS